MDELKGAILFEDRCYPVASDPAALDRVVGHLGRAALLAPVGTAIARPARVGCAQCRHEILNGAGGCPKCGGRDALYVVDVTGPNDITQHEFDTIRAHWKALAQGKSGPCSHCGKPLEDAFFDGARIFCSDHAQRALSDLVRDDLESFRKLLKRARSKAAEDELEPWEFLTAGEAPAKLGSKWDEIENTYSLSLAAERRSRRMAIFVAYPGAALACSWVGLILAAPVKFALKTSSNLPLLIGVIVGMLGGILIMTILRRKKKS